MTPLHHLGDFLREWFASIPLAVVRGIFIAVPVVLLIWVLLLPRHVTTPPGGPQRWDANLKIWAALALVIQIILYCIF
jgi:hypothetical protein